MSEFEDDYGEGYRAGILWEQKRIIALLEEGFPAGWDYAEKDPIASVVALIKGDPLKELQQLAEETGEHENFDNPLIDEKQKQKVQDYIDLLGIIGK
jgi:hypothetical protein